MVNQVRFMSKGALTEMAAKGLLSCMHPHMAEHAVLPTEELLANSAFIGHLSSIHFFVHNPVSLLVDTFLTGQAGMRFPFYLHRLWAAGKLPRARGVCTAQATGMTLVLDGWGPFHCHLGPYWHWKFVLCLAPCTAEGHNVALRTCVNRWDNGLDSFQAKLAAVGRCICRHG